MATPAQWTLHQANEVNLQGPDPRFVALRNNFVGRMGQDALTLQQHAIAILPQYLGIIQQGGQPGDNALSAYNSAVSARRDELLRQTRMAVAQQARGQFLQAVLNTTEGDITAYLQGFPHISLVDKLENVLLAALGAEPLLAPFHGYQHGQMPYPHHVPHVAGHVRLFYLHNQQAPVANPPWPNPQFVQNNTIVRLEVGLLQGAAVDANPALLATTLNHLNQNHLGLAPNRQRHQAQPPVYSWVMPRVSLDEARRSIATCGHPNGVPVGGGVYDYRGDMLSSVEALCQPGPRMFGYNMVREVVNHHGGGGASLTLAQRIFGYVHAPSPAVLPLLDVPVMALLFREHGGTFGPPVAPLWVGGLPCAGHPAPYPCTYQLGLGMNQDLAELATDPGNTFVVLFALPHLITELTNWQEYVEHAVLDHVAFGMRVDLPTMQVSPFYLGPLLPGGPLSGGFCKVGRNPTGDVSLCLGPLSTTIIGGVSNESWRSMEEGIGRACYIKQPHLFYPYPSVDGERLNVCHEVFLEIINEAAVKVVECVEANNELLYRPNAWIGRLACAACTTCAKSIQGANLYQQAALGGAPVGAPLHPFVSYLENHRCHAVFMSSRLLLERLRRLYG